MISYFPRSFQSSRSIRRDRGFTLIEIMVTVGIIVILATIAIGVGSGVKTSASIRSTHTTLKTLEGAMKDYLSAGNPEPASDQISWVKALRAFPETAKKLSNVPSGTDSANNVTILDSFGTAIAYVQYNSTTKKEGYFQSAGPDRVGGNADDLFSTDP